MIFNCDLPKAPKPCALIEDIQRFDCSVNEISTCKIARYEDGYLDYIEAFYCQDGEILYVIEANDGLFVVLWKKNE